MRRCVRRLAREHEVIIHGWHGTVQGLSMKCGLQMGCVCCDDEVARRVVLVSARMCVSQQHGSRVDADEHRAVCAVARVHCSS